MNAIDTLIEAAGRPAEALSGLRERFTPDILTAHPGGHPNSVGWLLWHIGREIDVQLADLSGEEEVWSSSGFRDRFDLGELGDGVGVGHTEEQAHRIVVTDSALAVDYVQAATDAFLAYLRTLSDEDLDAVIDDAWDPPVTRGVRLVSIVDDAAQHAGQAAYALGIPRG
ncbi:aspartate/tyrosine/aromatic aminotransferase [Brachybacterium endophyticum]|uniref:Aspartate/tyrosine/aromatic aminotransferase n=1 Tax=Brachybacterium endophyticum TaxID=2182385 RepID=A0A2U2RJV9_9MICO|nr:DinB family protein [Brachybacterium endophyticum]PWH06157.1 aspartate/tyrosine/aromatic aminotransferase [Brachybacterium endophyticum]